MSWGDKAAEQHEQDQPAAHDVEMIRVPVCILCGRDVVYDEHTQRWEHDD